MQILYGEIWEYKDGAARVNIQAEEITTGWLPIIYPNTTGLQTIYPLEKGSAVAVIMDEYAEDGVILGPYYTDGTTPSSSVDYYAKYPNGFKLESVTAEFSVSDSKFALKNQVESLNTLLTDLLTQLELMTYSSFGAPANNVAAITAIKLRIANLFNS